MSRIGKQPIPIPTGVKVSVDAAKRSVDLQGPKGKASLSYRTEIVVSFDEAKKSILCGLDDDKLIDVGDRRAYWGTTRANIRNMVEGVTQGYIRKLEVVGVGWNAKVQGKKIVLMLGYADPIELGITDGLKVEVDQGVNITISGTDRQAVGQMAALIRSQRKPEPYQGKGVKYQGEVIQRKQGKAFGA
ncbi:MAG: 50S ribosomal protein L6 [Phycisphaerales bacterium]|nr:50S ribosomal protein L6 [Phycisphaerales bacterium]